MASDPGLVCSVHHPGCLGKAAYVCHHCGRLLCNGPNCHIWMWDPALAGWPIAYHCPACDHLLGPFRMVRCAINWSNRAYDGLVVLVKWLKKTVAKIIQKVIDNLKQFFRRSRDLREAAA
jgi:hypothetical protein